MIKKIITLEGGWPSHSHRSVVSTKMQRVVLAIVFLLCVSWVAAQKNYIYMVRCVLFWFSPIFGGFPPFFGANRCDAIAGVGPLQAVLWVSSLGHFFSF